MIFEILYVLVAIISVFLINWCLVLYRNWPLHVIPGPRVYPYIGSIFPKDPFDYRDLVQKLHEKYGSIYRYYAGPYIYISFSRYENIKTILSSNVHLEKSESYKFFAPYLGEGLLLSNGNKWRFHRKLITSAFHFKILEKFMVTFNAAGHELIKQLDKEVGKVSVDIFEFLNFCTLDIICSTAMGVQINAQTNKNQPFVKAVRHFLEILIYRIFNVQGQFDWTFKYTSKYPKFVKTIKILQDLTTKVIKQRKEEINKSGKLQIDNDPNESGRRRTYALLDLLLAINDEDANKLTDDDLRDEINTFIFGGHDTTTSALAFTLLEIARNPDVQEKLYEEILLKCGSQMVDLTLSDLNELKYLEMVIKESLRMYPPAPIIERKLVEDTWIDGIKYPKGVCVTLAIFLAHHDPEFYPEPNKFDPERFSIENALKLPAYAYVPFSAGPRNCIGQKFAMVEMKSAIIKILQNFKLLPVPGFKEELGIMAILKPKAGVHIALERRKSK